MTPSLSSVTKNGSNPSAKATPLINKRLHPSKQSLKNRNPLNKSKKVFLSGITGDVSIRTIIQTLHSKYKAKFQVNMPMHPQHKKFNKGYAILTAPSSALKIQLIKDKCMRF